MMPRSARWLRWGAGIGAAIGFVVWAYDNDFFLNAGGPEAPLSIAIMRATGVSALLERGYLFYAEFAVIVFWPLVVLLAVGAALGWIASLAFARLR